ncbi:MAG TPA: hypothetical protein VK249_10165 [Anaerolineales bacterium]|nr:hypothetical protein [Anaerolineales bacterium]
MAFQDIRKSRKWLSREEVGFLALMLFILGLLLAANIYLARLLPGGEWLFLRWSSARAFLFEKIEPYSTEIAQRTQEVAYGRIAFSSEYAYVFNDPFYIALLYIPLAFFQDFTLARGIWMLLSEGALVGIVLFAFRLSEWQPARWLYICLLGFGLFNYFSLNALVTGTPTIMLTFVYLWILLALRSHSDELAGVLLFLVAYQWEVGGLFFLFILLFVFANHRWNVLGGFAMALFVLMMVSILFNSGWGLAYIRAVLSDWYRGANFTFGHLLSNRFSNVKFSIGLTVSIALGIILLIEWLGSVQANFRRVVWTASLSLAATPLIGFAIFPSNHVVLILPFILILALVWERWQRQRVLFSLLILLPVLLIPFGLYLRAVSLYDPLVNDLISALPPVAAVIGLYWMRWWVIHSPRVWFDQIGGHR